MDYIIAKYCVNKDKPEMHCNGKCHLMKQLAIDAPKKESAKTIRLIEAFYPVYFQEYRYKYSFNSIPSKEHISWAMVNDQKNRFLNVPVPPPKV